MFAATPAGAYAPPIVAAPFAHASIFAPFAGTPFSHVHISPAKPHVKPRPEIRPKMHPRPRPQGPGTGAYGLYDSVEHTALPGKLPAALYSNGSYSAPGSAAAGHAGVLWIDVHATNPHANVLDVEPGDATASAAGPWAVAAHRAHPRSPVIIYTFRAGWADAAASVRASGAGVKWWIADPTGVPHNLPGADATQWYWGSHMDISWTEGHFWGMNP